MTSIDDHRTISIEAGYGRGKTFFRERWAQELEAVCECVVQIDARLSDHSGDPVVTFLGALLGLVPEKETKKRDAAFSVGKKVAIAGAKAVARAALREGVDELAGAMAPQDGEASSLQGIAKAAGQDLSKAAGDLIATQLSAEKARMELGDQLKNLHAQITEGRETDRIIILIDELDRCHPDYAIALLEAMKLVFDQDGFVFVLMVNREYLENIASHRFGGTVKGEFYLDKFVDLRLKLEADDVAIAEAVELLASDLPLEIPFGENPVFGLKAAIDLASKLAPASGLSMRQIKRILERVELACRLYKDRPIDAPLLIWLAFQEVAFSKGEKIKGVSLVRAKVTPEYAEKLLSTRPSGRSMQDEETWVGRKNHDLVSEFPELASLNIKECRAPEDGQNYYPYYLVFNFLAPHYIPEHQAMLEAVHKLQVAD